MKPAPSLAGRVVLTLLLMVGYYLLSLAIAGGLLCIPYAEVRYADMLEIKLTIVSVFCALSLLWSIVPKFDRFERPGPELKRSQHPELFAELESVAKSMNQALPAEVYLVPDVNAWVAQRGGIMGIGSRRVMGLGLSLMRVLGRSQFRAVLAHEFGHFYGGDTRLGPWIYRTREAIGRTIESLEGHWLLQVPFLCYGKLFLRVTHAVSRRQELVADELAARAAGSQALIGGLRTIHGVGPAFTAYWVQECAPVLNAGYRPPIAEGFHLFAEAAGTAEVIKRQQEDALKIREADPYDTHPSIKERIAAIEHLPAGVLEADDPPATSLLNDLTGVESQLIATLLKPGAAEKLKPIAWNEVAVPVYLPQWTALCRVNSPALLALTPERLPRAAASLKDFGRTCRTPDGELPGPEIMEELACHVVGAVLGVLLSQRGAVFTSAPGQPHVATLGSTSIEPFGVMQSIADGKLTEEKWVQLCTDLGILGVDLGTAAPAQKTRA